MENAMSESEVINYEKKESFWNSILGKIIRWISYIPIAFIAIVIIEVLSYMFFGWLFRDMRGFIIIGILFGGLFTLLPMVVMLYYFALFLSVNICPSPKVGSIIFGVLYGLGAITQIIKIFTIEGAGIITTFIVIKIIFIITTIVTITNIYQEEN